jgi:hypothetical protein
MMILKALEKQKQAQEARTEALSNMFEMGVDALSSMVDGSMRAEDAIKRLAVQLALAAAQAALLGSGPLAGLFGGGFGSLLGGGLQLPAIAPIPTPRPFAKGTDFAPGGLSLVGEQGPELVNLPRGAQVIPNHQLGQAMGGGQQSVKVQVEARFVKDGEFEVYVTDVAYAQGQKASAEGIARYDKGADVRASRDLQNANSRGYLR